MSENTEHTAAPPGTLGPPTAAPVPRTARQRRPTGAPPPLPHPIAVSTTAWLLLVVIILGSAFAVSERTPWLRLGDRTGTWLLRLLADGRTPWLTDVAEWIKEAGSGWGVTVVGVSVLALTMIFRRWRHLLVFLGGLFFLVTVGQWIYFGLSRPRPYGVRIISSWGGFSAPSPPVAVLTFFLIGAVYCLVVPGRPRAYAKAAVAATVVVFCLKFWLDSDQAGPQALTITLAAACDVSGARPAPSDQAGTRRFERPMTRGTQFAELRFYTFPGGCVTYQFNFAPGAPALLATGVHSAVAFMPRATLVAWVRNKEGLALCGWGAACPG